MGKLHEITLYNKDQKRKRIALYSKKPARCGHCDQALSYEKRHCKFCNHSCSASYNNLGVCRHGVQHVTKPCGFCGETTLNPKYCSNACTQGFRWEQRKKDIEAGGVQNPLTLRHYLVEKHGHQCSICANIEWQRKSIPLILDHVNGNPYDNKVKNLRMICPNCDAQTDTYKGRNKGKGRHCRMVRYKAGKSY